MKELLVTAGLSSPQGLDAAGLGAVMACGDRPHSLQHLQLKWTVPADDVRVCIVEAPRASAGCGEQGQSHRPPRLGQSRHCTSESPASPSAGKGPGPPLPWPADRAEGRRAGCVSWGPLATER